MTMKINISNCVSSKTDLTLNGNVILVKKEQKNYLM